MRATALTQRVGRWWAIEIPEAGGLHTQAERFEDVGAMAREAVSLVLEIPEDQIDVDVRVVHDLEARAAGS